MSNKFELHHQWIEGGRDAPEISQTMATLKIQLDDVNLTKHKWSEELREEIIVSAYPLATWLAHSWWRLLYEPLFLPSNDWRMSHEIGAVNHGFVWPKLAFISDGECIYLFAKSIDNISENRVCYLNGLKHPVPILINDFKNSLSLFINSVVERLDKKSVTNSDLKLLWDAVQEEQNNAESHTYRKLEAQMGYDPDECPEALMNAVLALLSQIEETTLSELMPTYGEKAVNSASIQYLNALIGGKGIEGQLNLPDLSALTSNKPTFSMMPWKQAVDAAKATRKALGNIEEKIKDKVLFDLLGVIEKEFENWQINPSQKNFSLAIPLEQQKLKFLPRKSHPLAKRFELARFLGDYIYTHTTHSDAHCLTSTDLSTARQKYQRAFAAAFLCPIEGLKSVLQEDFSEPSIKKAAYYFGVSQQTVSASLQNNHILEYAVEDNSLGMSYHPWSN